MRYAGPAALGLLGLAACADLLAPRAGFVSLTIVPTFDAADPSLAAAGTADSLRITVVRDSSGVFADTVARVTAPIDPATGEVVVSVGIVLLQSPQLFKIVLQALRNPGLVIFSGQTIVRVTSASAGGEGQRIEIPIDSILYVGPRAARIQIAPKDTALTGAAVAAFRVTAFDALDAVQPGVEIRFFHVNPADSSKLRLGRFTGIATPVAGQTGEVRIYARTIDGAAYDTARVFVGAVPGGARVTPGYANLGAADTLTFTGQVIDVGGNPVANSTVTWASRNPAIATINPTTGKATGVAPGTAVLVATSGTFGDSALVTVATSTHAVVSTTSQGRAFRGARVGDTVVVDVTTDMRFTPTEKLGSYNGTLTWSPATLGFIDVQNGSFVAPTVNTANALNGELRFSAADAAGAAGSVVVARVRFRALAAGTTTTALVVSEMSGAITFTNLYGANRVTVTNGTVAVRP